MKGSGRGASTPSLMGTAARSPEPPSPPPPPPPSRQPDARRRLHPDPPQRHPLHRPRQQPPPTPSAGARPRRQHAAPAQRATFHNGVTSRPEGSLEITDEVWATDAHIDAIDPDGDRLRSPPGRLPSPGGGIAGLGLSPSPQQLAQGGRRDRHQHEPHHAPPRRHRGFGFDALHLVQPEGDLLPFWRRSAHRRAPRRRRRGDLLASDGSSSPTSPMPARTSSPPASARSFSAPSVLSSSTSNSVGGRRGLVQRHDEPHPPRRRPRPDRGLRGLCRASPLARLGPQGRHHRPAGGGGRPPPLATLKGPSVPWPLCAH